MPNNLQWCPREETQFKVYLDSHSLHCLIFVCHKYQHRRSYQILCEVALTKQHNWTSQLILWSPGSSLPLAACKSTPADLFYLSGCCPCQGVRQGELSSKIIKRGLSGRKTGLHSAWRTENPA